MQLRGGRILHSFTVCGGGGGRERGGPCLLMNLRFVFLPGGRAGPGVPAEDPTSQLRCRRVAGTLPWAFLRTALTCRMKPLVSNQGQQCTPAPGPCQALPRAAGGLPARIHPTLSRCPAPGLRRWPAMAVFRHGASSPWGNAASGGRSWSPFSLSFLICHGESDGCLGSQGGGEKQRRIVLWEMILGAHKLTWKESLVCYRLW